MESISGKCVVMAQARPDPRATRRNDEALVDPRPFVIYRAYSAVGLVTSDSKYERHDYCRRILSSRDQIISVSSG